MLPTGYVCSTSVHSLPPRADVLTGLGIRQNIRQIQHLNPDLVNLHWVCGGYVRAGGPIAKFKKPIVWTLRDMWGVQQGAATMRWLVRNI